MAKKILLADDSITIQKVISITFASENYELIIVGDGESALKRAKEARPDLIMADVAMPGKTGYEVCEAVKSDPDLSGTPVMLLAGTFEPLDRDEAERVGADESIVKPFESQELLNKVALLLAKAPERESKPSVEQGAPFAQETGAGAQDSWGESDFIGFPEELEEKPAIKGADQLPDLDFLDNGGLFEEPAKDFSQGEGFTDLEFDESEGFGQSYAGGKPETQPAPVQSEPVPAEPEPVEDAAIEAEPEAPQAPFGQMRETVQDAPEPTPVETEAPRPFWAENVSRDDNYDEPMDISEFPDLYAEEPEDAGETAEVIEQPEPVEEPAEGPFEKAFEEAEPSFSTEPMEGPAEEPFEKPFEPAEPSFGAEPVEEPLEKAFEEAESSFEAGSVEEQEPVRMEEEAPFEAEPVEEAETAFEQPQQYGEASAVPEAFEPAGAEFPQTVAGRAEAAVAEKAAGRLSSIEVPREELEEAVRKAVRDVVQEIAWEVVPELAEELIRAEIDKVKEALTRLK